MQLDKEELQVMMAQAAEMGATNALKNLGLHDEQARKDVVELRAFILLWRETKSTVIRTVTQFIVGALLATLAVGFYLKGK